ncbi:hypothetical protein [Sutcliffiella halmapala]|uniref:hypothetical protein n=1 Tax=Sutcliffiella halmapala TaxID=79882 RepID=UPI0009954A1E|nr:hypothetical protein [Sutcliffiella halmapala]
MKLDPYIGQIVLVKTMNGDILLSNIKSKHSPYAYSIKIIEKNEKNCDLDIILTDESIERICLLPIEVQKGIELTRQYFPLDKFINADLPSEIEFGRTKKDLD